METTLLLKSRLIISINYKKIIKLSVFFECPSYALESREIKVSRSKTEYLCINEGNDEKKVNMEDTKIPRVKEFKYLGSTVQKSDSCEWEVRNGWRKASGVICNRRLPARVKGKVYNSVVRPEMVYGLEMVAVTK